MGEYDGAINDYKKYLSAPFDDIGVSATDRDHASKELDEVSELLSRKAYSVPMPPPPPAASASHSRASGGSQSYKSKDYEVMSVPPMIVPILKNDDMSFLMTEIF